MRNFSMRNFLIHLAIGLVCGVLNTVLHILVVKYSIPLFLDTILTAAASFISCTSGVVAAVSYHLIVFDKTNLSDLAFVLCSLTVVLGIRFALRKQPEENAILCLIISVILAIIISFEGGIIFSIIFTHFHYKESIRTSYASFVFLKSQIPLLVSSILARIPANTLDKILSVFAGWYISKGFRICLKKAKLQSEQISVA